MFAAKWQQRPETGIKLALKKWNTNFCLEYSIWKNRTTFSHVLLLPEIFYWNNPKKLCSIYFPPGFSRNFLYVVYNHCYITKNLHSSGSELPAVETHLILFSHPLFLFLCTIRSNITDNSDFPSVISTCVLPSLKASVIILTCSLEYLVHVDLSASLSHVREVRLGELKLEAAARTVPFVSTFTFFDWVTVASVVSLLSELAKNEK